MAEAKEGIRLGKYLKGALTVGDFIVLNLSYILTLLIAPYGFEFASRWVWLICNVAFIPSAMFFGGCHNDRILYADRVVLNAIKSVALQVAVMLGLLYLFDIFEIGLKTMLCFVTFLILLLSLWWVLSRFILKRLRRRGINFKRSVIVGTGLTAKSVYDELQSDAGYGYRVLGIFDKGPRRLSKSGRIIESLDIIEDFVRENKIDVIYYALGKEDSETMSRLMRISEEIGADFVFVPMYDPVLGGQFQPSNVGNIPSMKYTLSPLHYSFNKVVKRVFDLCISVPFLVVSPIIFIPIAIGIKMSSPGPVFFKQKRTGIYGRDFMCYKFRTMKVNADSDRLQATKDDPRKTKFGDFLRRSSIDELPQFINVLIGNMSVVGPRPHMVSHTEEYSALIDKYMVRHAVKPGITGWAQVNGYRGGTKHLWQMEKRVQYDVWYIRHWNLILDIKIVFLTAFNGLRGEQNAY